MQSSDCHALCPKSTDIYRTQCVAKIDVARQSGLMPDYRPSKLREQGVLAAAVGTNLIRCKGKAKILHWGRHRFDTAGDGGVGIFSRLDLSAACAPAFFLARISTVAWREQNDFVWSARACTNFFWKRRDFLHSNHDLVITE
jgi:hypothetical protein